MRALHIKDESTKDGLIRGEVKLFSSIAHQLAKESGKSIETVVNQMINSKYNRLISGGMSHAEIGYIFGITRERIRQLEDRIRKILKTPNMLVNNTDIKEEIDRIKRNAIIDFKRNKGRNRSATR
jgi:Sigma-70, region 4